ncbi:ribose-phosphate pyrophosphokinase, partial [Gammaproteobacteria bacterium]|nr:ribose-phosphate pyrophosphokinase [Gammaproteobacteria bacterium]
CCTHPVLSGKAVERIEASELDEVVVTNSIPLSEEAINFSTKIRQISVASLLAESIRRIASGDSVSSLFLD